MADYGTLKACYGLIAIYSDAWSKSWAWKWKSLYSRFEVNLGLSIYFEVFSDKGCTQVSLCIGPFSLIVGFGHPTLRTL